MKKIIESDSELIGRFLQGDKSGIELLFTKHQDRLYGYILFLVKREEAAEDIFQDTFYRIFQSISQGKYNDDGRFFSWASRIAHNLVIDYFRDKKKLSTLSIDDEDAPVVLSTSDVSIEDVKVNQQFLNEIKGLIDHLSLDQREVVIMRMYLDMSYKEIAEITQVSINTSLGRMRYAILNLRKLVKEHQIFVH
jgi:RNA polymerase sigma-70 factor (ECF subfamily)